MSVINIAHKFSLFSDTWSPRIVGELNGQQVKLARLEGEFEWHSHDNEDELFMVITGRLKIHLRDGMVEINQGEFYIVPRGIEHKPVAVEGTEVLLFEPATTLHTGNLKSERTVDSPEWI
jgi:mannose-6-phosphate isomerase-like protein (cupin superfamily)